jgi:opacity protein-like surface antigen
MVYSVRNAVFRLRRVLVCSAAVLAVASPVFAGGQNPSGSSSSQAQSGSPSDFLIGSPRASVGVRGSWFMPSAGSDIFDFITDEFTLEKSSFNSGSFSADFGFALNERFEILGGFDVNSKTQRSEDRDEEELLPNGTRVPITQETGLEQFNVMVSAKYSLVPRGRAISKLAWIPNTFVPYVGAGVGYGKYTFRQDGDFVDFVDKHIFTDTFRSEGWAPVFQAFGGTDIQMYKRLLLTLEGRYSWSHADLGTDFLDFEPIDLGGFRFGAGIRFGF